MTLPLPPPPASEATAVIVPVLLAYLDQLAGTGCPTPPR